MNERIGSATDSIIGWVTALATRGVQRPEPGDARLRVRSRIRAGNLVCTCSPVAPSQTAATKPVVTPGQQ
jgi:hypothetical protein